MAHSSMPVNDTSVSGESVDDVLLVSPIKRICYYNSKNSVIPEKRHCKGFDLAVPDEVPPDHALQKLKYDIHTKLPLESYQIQI